MSDTCEKDLEKFRNQWLNELKRSDGQSDADLEQEVNARVLFSKGAKLEEEHKMFDAMLCYRKATQLVPDIEFKMKDGVLPHQAEVESLDSSDEDEAEVPSCSYQQPVSKGGATLLKLCEPETPVKGVAHISDIPTEIVMLIFRWVVGSHLDIRSIDNLSMVSRGFHACARDAELWKGVCQKVWGLSCTKPSQYPTWRDMCLFRPHLLFDGVYIGKISYTRPGEQTMEQFCRPWHIVYYYRYIRFFPDGTMLMLTTCEQPASIVGKLRYANTVMSGVLVGYYRVIGQNVAGVLRRRRPPEQPTAPLYRRRKADAPTDNETVFQVEFALKKAGRRRHAQLAWQRYVLTNKYASGAESETSIDLNHTHYPSLYFSRVHSYTAACDSML